MLIESLDWTVRLATTEVREAAMLFRGEQRRSSGTETETPTYTAFKKVKLAGVAVDKYVMVIEKADKTNYQRQAKLDITRTKPLTQQKSRAGAK